MIIIIMIIIIIIIIIAIIIIIFIEAEKLASSAEAPENFLHPLAAAEVITIVVTIVIIFW